MAEPVRVAVLASTLVTGGAEQLLYDLLARMDRQAFDLRLGLLQADPGPLGREIGALGVPMVTGLRAGRIDPFCIWRIWRWLRLQAVQVVLGINHLDALLYGLPAATAAGAAFVNWENETSRLYRAHALTMAVRRCALSRVDRVVAAAEGHGRYVTQIEGVPPGRITVIRNGVDPARSASTLPPDEARERLGLAPDAPVVVQVAALRPDKAHEVMLEAFAAVRRQVPEAVLLLAGDGPRTGQRRRPRPKHRKYPGARRETGSPLPDRAGRPRPQAPRALAHPRQEAARLRVSGAAPRQTPPA